MQPEPPKPITRLAARPSPRRPNRLGAAAAILAVVACGGWCGSAVTYVNPPPWVWALTPLAIGATLAAIGLAIVGLVQAARHGLERHSAVLALVLVSLPHLTLGVWLLLRWAGLAS